MKCLLYIPTGEYVSFSSNNKFNINLENYIDRSIFLYTLDDFLSKFIFNVNSFQYNPLFIKVNKIQIPSIEEEFEIIEISDTQKEGTCVNK